MVNLDINNIYYMSIPLELIKSLLLVIWWSYTLQNCIIQIID